MPIFIVLTSEVRSLTCDRRKIQEKSVVSPDVIVSRRNVPFEKQVLTNECYLH